MTIEEVQDLMGSEEARVRVPIDFAHAIEQAKMMEASQFVRIEDLLAIEPEQEGVIGGVSIYTTGDGEPIGGAWVTLDSGQHIFASFDSMTAVQ